MEFQKVFISDKASLSKKQARESLIGNWKRSLDAAKILIVSVCIVPLFVILGGVFVYGISGIFLKTVRRQEWQVSDMFSGFRDFGRVMRLWIWVFGNILIASLPLILLSALLSKYDFLARWILTPTTYTPLELIGSVVVLIMVCIWPMLQYIKYSQVFFLIIDHKDMNTRSAVAASIKLMKWNEKKMLFLILSFVGWVLLMAILVAVIYIALFTISSMALKALIVIAAAIVLFIGASLLTVYGRTACAVFYEKITGRRSQRNPKVIFDETIVL